MNNTSSLLRVTTFIGCHIRKYYLLYQLHFNLFLQLQYSILAQLAIFL